MGLFGSSLRAAGLLLASLSSLACGEDGQPAGTKRMVEQLEAIARRAELGGNEFYSSSRVRLLRRAPTPSDSYRQLLQRAQLARELLNTGLSEAAITEYETVQQLLRGHERQVPDDFPRAVRKLLAISYLRLGEQENCLLDHTIRRCLLPISRDAIHEKERGSRSAIALYQSILTDQPNDLTSRWLLNIAYMTLGEHPERVPPRWVIPASAFASEYDIKRFPDVAPDLGLDVVGLSGGSIMDDFDGDGYLDIMASSWGLRDQLRYFRNNADGSFGDRTMDAGIQGIVGGLHIVHTDYNNDGFPDVLVLRGAWLQEGHPNSLLRNNGDGSFTDVTQEAGLLPHFPTQTAAWGDFDNDGWLDVFIGNESVPRGKPNPSQLFRNNGDGTFTDVAAQAGVAVVGFVKGVVWGDYDNDGLLDLYVSRLGETNLLFNNNGAATDGAWHFREVAERAGVQHPVQSFPTWFFDYDNDGWLDLFVSGYRARAADVAAEYLGQPHLAELPRLYRNAHDGTFDDVTEAARVNRIMYTMGSNFGDLDNDGFLDFYVGTGDPDFRALMPNRMFRNAAGWFFQDVTSSGGFGHLQKGHGVAFGDIDNDGDQDIYAVIGGAFEGDVFQNALFLNPGHGNSWITLRLEGVASNRPAIGARIKVVADTPTGSRTYYRTVSSGGSFGASSLQQELGLGDATALTRLEITWPATGATDVYRDIPLGRLVRIREGDLSAAVDEPRRVDLTSGESAATDSR